MAVVLYKPICYTCRKDLSFRFMDIKCRDCKNLVCNDIKCAMYCTNCKTNDNIVCTVCLYKHEISKVLCDCKNEIIDIHLDMSIKGLYSCAGCSVKLCLICNKLCKFCKTYFCIKCYNSHVIKCLCNKDLYCIKNVYISVEPTIMCKCKKRVCYTCCSYCYCCNTIICAACKKFCTDTCTICHKINDCHNKKCKTHNTKCETCYSKYHVETKEYKCYCCSKTNKHSLCCFHDLYLQYKRYPKKVGFSRCECSLVGCLDHTRKCVTCKLYKCFKCIKNRSTHNIKIFTCNLCTDKKLVLLNEFFNEILNISVSLKDIMPIIIDYVI